MNNLTTQIMYEGEPIPEKVIQIATEYNLYPKDLDWHVEAIHGWERHDAHYNAAIYEAARCLIDGGCE